MAEYSWLDSKDMATSRATYEVFDWIKFGLQQRLPSGVHLDGALMQDFLEDELVLKINGYVLGKRQPKVKTVSQPTTMEIYVPRTTWQFFKETHKLSWWLRWFVERYPVKYTRFEDSRTLEVTVDVTTIYPYQDVVPHDRLGQPVHLYSFNPEMKWSPFD